MKTRHDFSDGYLPTLMFRWVVEPGCPEERMDDTRTLQQLFVGHDVEEWRDVPEVTRKFADRAG